MDKLCQRKGHWVAFLAALALATIVFIPFIIINKGYFFFYGDFNVQQIPFYQLAHDAVRNGEFFWNWNTDLGANFIGSYSFYLLFSPFFWLTLLLPNSWLPFAMAPLLVLKTGCAAFTSYFFIKRFVKENVYAVMGSLLYAFSGFAVYNIFFNHFHEAIIFFPLMLVGLEELMVNDRRGLFAIAVAINAVVNYWFFIGEVIFIILYFILRSTARDTRFRFSTFARVTFEGVLGVALAAAVFIPSVLAIIGNPRTGADDLLHGWSLWTYAHPQRYLAILHAMFFPPDMPSIPNFFLAHGAKWASLSAYLPLFGLSGVIAYWRSAGKTWLKRLLLVCAFFAFIPGLNSLFVLLNNSYYARWFYMPILLLCVVTTMAVENKETRWGGAIGWSIFITAAIGLAVGLSPKLEEGEWSIGLAGNPVKMWVNTGIALICLGFLAWLMLRRRRRPGFKTALAGFLCFICVGYTMGSLLGALSTFPNNQWIPETALAGRGKIDLPGNQFARSDFYEGRENLGMYWDLPNIQAFHSIVPVSIMEFYPSVGVKRDVSSKPDVQYFELRALLGVRWLFIPQETVNQEPMPYFSYYDAQMGYNIYENDSYIPLGFGYEYYITRQQFEETTEGMRSRLLVKALLVEDDDIAKVEGLLKPLPMYMLNQLSNDAFLEDVDARRQNAAYNTQSDRWGMVSQAQLAEEEILFYSIPYDVGWRATVNGQPAELLKVNGGFLGLRVPAGEAQIIFDYYTPGLAIGGVISGAALLILLAYMLIPRARLRKVRRSSHPPLPTLSALPPLPQMPDLTNLTLEDIEPTVQPPTAPPKEDTPHE